MPRSLSAALDLINSKDTSKPSFRVFIYDIMSTQTDAVPLTFGNVVNGAAEGVKREFTDNIESITITEVGSDSLAGTLGSLAIRMRFVDRLAEFDPVDGSSKNWLRQGNVVRVYEGDEDLLFSEWVSTFTGRLTGQAGRETPDRSGNSILDIPAEDRSAEFLKFVSTSISFAQGTSYKTMMTSLAEKGLGLTAPEFDFGTTGSKITAHSNTQFVDESPLVSIMKTLFIDGFVPRFNGEGKLTQVILTSTKNATRSFQSSNTILSIARPFNPLKTTNSVIIKGIDADMTRIFQATNVVATAGITLGFFGGDASLRVQFSDDGTIFVNNPRLRIISSVTGGLVPFGGDEKLKIKIVDTDPLDSSIQGATEGRIEVEGGFYAPLVVTNFGGRIAASFIPDTVVSIGGGSTIPVGRIVEGVISISISLVEASIGRGDYEIIGEAYEYVFKELLGQAKIANLVVGDEIIQEKQNHLLTSQAEVDSVALRELKTVRKRGNARTFEMRHDLKLEADDMFRTSNNSSFIITNISRTLKRGEPRTAIVQTFETTAGVNQ